MKVNPKTLELLCQLITGSSDITEYQSGPKLVKFFKELGFEDQYGKGFPSRYEYTYDRIELLNEENRIDQAVEALLNPLDFLGKKKTHEELMRVINEYLEYDNLKVILEGKKARVLPMDTKFSEVESLQKIDNHYIHEQIQKCNSKITMNDYSGAITNARSLVEHLLEYLYSEFTNETLEETELPKKYKKVSKLLNLAPENHSSDEIKQILSGFFSIINGFSCFRNDWSDSHARKYNPEKRHAILAVNSALTISEFLYSSFEYQKQIDKGAVPSQ
jgi:hypothetical protein